MYKKLVLFILLFCLLLLTSCNVQKKYEVIYNDTEPELSKEAINENKKSKIYTIALVPKVEEIPYFVAVKEGAMEAGEDLKVKVIFKGPPSPDPKQQAEVIRELIDQHVDVIAVSANDPVELGSVLQDAQEKGIKVLTWDSDTDPKLREFFINMIDPEIMGRHLMDLLAMEMQEQGEYAILTGSPNAANLNEWTAWLQLHQREYYPKMKLVKIEYTNEDIHKAYNVTKKVLKNYPNLEGMIGLSTVTPPAIAQALKDLGNTERIAFVGTSTPNLMRDYLKEGSAQTITLWSPQKLGYLTVTMAKSLLDGEWPYHGQSIRKIGNIEYDGDMVIMGQPIDFTKENVDQYDF
ncbi:autoinducer 2 ABC transporter substrate-binding protein [Domibacillus indicus]|uniref:autoinducer 2 ABC transporter substrate-binding protein n=1 Tax=Domibacillus indicus TaxID=1437523 RepID=UPI0020419663|nr:autoinducer 2 ABC transporter substrate-binding protein [Domibacillus indicus]MCM3790709.1 autoinducer 2 ABC transporter substrate-binding protein [Domibacillus indicus]